MENSVMDGPEFNEQQRFCGWEMIAFIGFLMAGLTYRFIDQQLIHPVDNGMSFWIFSLFLLVLSASLIYLLLLRISVYATPQYISFRVSPWSSRKVMINWDDVVECEIVETPVLAQWSGANIRAGHERLYSVNGRNGLHLVTREGDSFFIGSRKLDELREFLQPIFKS